MKCEPSAKTFGIYLFQWLSDAEIKSMRYQILVKWVQVYAPQGVLKLEY